MARRTFDVIDICDIFTHWQAGRSNNEIGRQSGLSRNTVRKYVAAAEAAGMRPGGAAVSPEEWATTTMYRAPRVASHPGPTAVSAGTPLQPPRSGWAPDPGITHQTPG